MALLGEAMAYLCKDEATRNIITGYINEYVKAKGMSPSIRDIAAGTGISRAMVQRYMAAMREDGEITYGRRSITTATTRKLQGENAVIPFGGAASCGVREADAVSYFTFPRAFVGEGEHYLLTAEDDALVGAGIEEGDLLLLRLQEDFADGDIVLVETSVETFVLRSAYRRAGGILLCAQNPKYSDSMPREARVLGVVQKVIHDCKIAKNEENAREERSSLQVFLL